MTWGTKRKRGWAGEDEREDSWGGGLRGIVRNIMEVVPGGVIRAGKTAYSDDAHVGFWLGVDSDGLAKFNLGGPALYLRWNGARLELAGSLRTKNGYVQIVDESEEEFGEGLRLLMGTWGQAGGLRWDDTAGRPGGVIAAEADAPSTGSSTLRLRAYTRATTPGVKSVIELAAYPGQVAAPGQYTGFTAVSDGLAYVMGNLVCQPRDYTEPLLLVGAASDGTGDLLRVVDENEAVPFAVGPDGTVRVAGDQVVGERQAAISAPSGGATVDGEARAAIGDILAALRAHGLIAT